MMSVLEWKLFDFIKLFPIKPPIKYLNLNKDITNACYNSTFTVLCDSQGGISVSSSEWDFTHFQTKGQAIHLCAITETNLLITLEQDAITNNIELQLYNLNKMIKRHQVVVVSKAHLECSYEVTVMKAMLFDAFLVIAIGLTNGYILFHKASICRDLSVNFRPVHVCSKSIKGINFVHRNEDNAKMFVCTDSSVVCFSLFANGTETKVVLDNAVHPIFCCTTYLFGENEYYFIVGRDDALYCYTADGRGPCFAIDGRKQLLEWFGKHLIVVLSTQGDDCHIIIIDIENKILVLNDKIEAIEAILPVDNHNNCYIILKNRQILTLQERGIQSKLQLLFDKNLYDIALKILCGLDTAPNCLATTYAKYGDYMLQRGDLNSAVKMYVQSIGGVSPFSIITKLMDLKHKQHLIEYMTALVNSPYATEKHMELLKNCQKRNQISSKMETVFEPIEFKENDLNCTIENLHFNDDSNKTASLLLKACHNKDQFRELFVDMKKGEILSFFKKYGTTIMLKHPAEFSYTIDTVCLQKLDYSTFQQYIVPILLRDQRVCVNHLNSLKQRHHSICEPNLYNIWLELVLLEWKNQQANTKSVLEFIRKNNNYLCDKDVLIACRHYSFWEGIIMTLIKSKINLLKVRYIFKNYSESYLDATLFGNDIFGDCYPLGLRALNREKRLFDNSPSVIRMVLTAMFDTYPEFLLKSLQNVLSTDNFLISHVINLLTKDKLSNMLQTNITHEINDLCVRLEDRYSLLKSYLKKPIEYRGDICEICKQSIKLPAIFYLCQHSYHKECHGARVRGTSCIRCVSKKGNANLTTQLVSTTEFSHNSNILKGSAHILSQGVFYKLNEQIRASSLIAESTNPFL